MDPIRLRVLHNTVPEAAGHTERAAANKQSEWSRRCGDRHAFRKLKLPGYPDGRVGRVTLYERGDNVLLRWRQSKCTEMESITLTEYKDVVAYALLRASEINRELEREGRRCRQDASLATALH